MRRWMLVGAMLCAMVAAPAARAQAPCADTRSAQARSLDQALTMVKLAELLDMHAQSQETLAAELEKQALAKTTEAKKLRDAMRGRPDAEASASATRASSLDAEASAARAQAVEARRDGADSRKRAKEIREEAIRIAKSIASTTTAVAKEPPPDCEPPYTWSLDGRKHYKLACL